MTRVAIREVEFVADDGGMQTEATILRPVCEKRPSVSKTHRW